MSLLTSLIKFELRIDCKNQSTLRRSEHLNHNWLILNRMRFLFTTNRCSINIALTVRKNKEQRTSCEGLVSKEECKKTIEMFENGKTPGNDGIPIEFYKKLWDILADQLVNVFNYSF